MMIKFSPLAASAFVLLALAAPSFAEDAAKPAADAAPVTEEAPAPTGPMIAESADKAEVGQPYWGAANGDWKMRCFKTAEGDDPCEAFQVLSDGTISPDGQLNMIAEMSVFDIPDGEEAVLGAAIIAPLETDLRAGLALQIDGGAPKQYPYSFCSISGCIARVGFTAADVAELKKGNEAKLMIVPAAAPDKQVDIKISLKGVTAAIDALPKAPNPPKP